MNKETSNCSFCNEHIETLRHLFIDCRYVKLIWNDLQTLFNETLSDEQKLFGLFEKIDDNAFDLLSHITILTKQCIHVSRMVSSKPTYRQVMRKISEVEIKDIKLVRRLVHKKPQKLAICEAPFLVFVWLHYGPNKRFLQ